MKCRCGSPATHRRHAPWEAKGTELLCDPCADQVTDRLNRRQADLDHRRPVRITLDMEAS
jgi:hypothetical protein